MKNVFFAFLLLITTSCAIVGPGERGVRISLGSVSTEVKEPGAYLWIPMILGMAKVNVQIQKSEIEASAASSDMQEVKTHVAVNWSLSPEKTVQTYKTIGDEDDVLQRIISPAVNEAFKAAIAKHTANDILAKRLILKQEIDALLMARLANYGVTLNDVSIVNLTFSSEFTKAIEQKQIAEQEAEQAKYHALKAIEDAKAAVNQARGQAESQRLVKETITPALLQKLAIEKWNGEFPQVMGQGSVPFINMSLKGDAK